MSQADEVPALCEACLGTNPYLRMMRERNGLECKLCTRPFTVFKWVPEKNGKFKNTIICLTCSRQRNCCQSCLLDLTYGIPIQLRDAALKMAGVEGINSSEPSNAISKLYVANNEEKFDKLGGASITSSSEKAREILTKLALASNNKPVSKKEKEKEELPQHIDKIDVSKIISKLPLNGSLIPPEDQSITSLFIFGIDDSLPEYKIQDHFEQYGKIKSFNCQHKAKCGYITFQSRKEAEAAAQALGDTGEKTPGSFVIDSIPLKVTWGKERPLGATSGEKLKVSSFISKVLRKLAKNQSDNLSKKRAIEDIKEDKTIKKAATKKKPGNNEAETTYASTSTNYEF